MSFWNKIGLYSKVDHEQSEQRFNATLADVKGQNEVLLNLVKQLTENNQQLSATIDQQGQLLQHQLEKIVTLQNENASVIETATIKQASEHMLIQEKLEQMAMLNDSLARSMQGVWLTSIANQLDELQQRAK